MFTPSIFEVLTASTTWAGSLARMFQTCQELTEGLKVDVRADLTPRQFCARTNVFQHAALADLGRDIESIIEHYPLNIAAPFEGVTTIAGGIWKGSELLDADREDALLKLRFEAGTRCLPMHSHDHSDRVIFVGDGDGTFEFLTDGKEHIESIQVSAGDVLVFTRGTIHTFKTAMSDLVLLSYHAPFVGLDDPRQYTLWPAG